MLHQLTKEKKKYIEQVSPQRKKLIKTGIKAQRNVLEKLAAKPVSKKKHLHQIHLKLPNLRQPVTLSQKASAISAQRPLPEQLKRKVKSPPKLKLLSKEKLRSKNGLPKPKKGLPFDISAIKRSIESGLEAPEEEFQTTAAGPRKAEKGYMFTGITGFDALLEKGIPQGAAVLVAGGAGSGKTIFGLQTCINQVKNGVKCLYMSFEESEEKLIKHMQGFSWDSQKYIKNKTLLIKRFSPFEITRNVDALLMQAKGELLIDIQPIIFPLDFKPEIIVVDSLTALSSAFTGKEDSYRIYIEQLFRFFESINATSFLITETEQVPKIFSTSGVEEFLADAVVVFYNIQRGNIRERAIEILKLRGAAHKNKIVAASITKNGLEVFPEQEVFGEIGK